MPVPSVPPRRTARSQTRWLAVRENGAGHEGLDTRQSPGQRKERGGFNPDRLGEVQRPTSVIPRIVGGGPMPRPAPPETTPLIPPAPPARRALQESPPRAGASGFTDVRI